MTEINGRTAFITGGANGIGLAMARALAREGAKLAIVDIDEDALTSAQRELAKVTDVEIARLDVRDRGEFARVADRVEQKLGPVSLLFNNAGVAGGAPVDRLTYELWDWGMGINLDGVINGIQTFLPRMIERGDGGHVVNTSSIAGLVAGPSGVLYHTAKYAVAGLTEALALELEPLGIGVSLLCPGPVATGIIDRTRAAQPKVTRSMSTEQRKAAFAQSQVFAESLATGTSPEAVAEMVLAAIRSNRLHILTCKSAAAQIAARGEALLGAMPT